MTVIQTPSARQILYALILFTLATVQSIFAAPTLISGESLDGKGVWIDPALKKESSRSVRVVVWFDRQFLGDGKAYLRRAKELRGIGRRELRTRTIASLKKLSADSHQEAKGDLDKLLKNGTIRNIKPHWIVNGFSCSTTAKGVKELAKIKGVKKIFNTRGFTSSPTSKKKATAIKSPDRPTIVSTTKLPWYISKLQADKVWKELGITGAGTLNIVHDRSFAVTPSLTRTIYKNSKEIPGNEKDDDGNGLIDDAHGYDFSRNSGNLNTLPLKGDVSDKKNLHGTSCAHIICGATTKDGIPQFGIAPMSRWAGVITRTNIEAAVEWSIEQGADTYSMSFTKSNMGETRTHWRKIMEHGSFCGVFFVSGAGNHAQKDKVPVQMRVPQSIPEAVFAAAGVQQDLSRSTFSSKGPVHWDTEHYKDGIVHKPEVCAFNHKLPLLLPDGSVHEDQLRGNSFAGPMFCGTISLMISADPDLLPWDLKKIITATATDVGPEGIDSETGHGLINCYRAVKEVLRRKKLRQNKTSNH